MKIEQLAPWLVVAVLASSLLNVILTLVVVSQVKSDSARAEAIVQAQAIMQAGHRLDMIERANEIKRLHLEVMDMKK